jgi:hypothetical protein
MIIFPWQVLFGEFLLLVFTTKQIFFEIPLLLMTLLPGRLEYTQND